MGIISWQCAITVLIDTGADQTIISLGLAADFKLGPISPKLGDLLAMDFSHVNEALSQSGSGPVDAIAGVNIFEAHKAVIDYDSSSLYLKM